MVILDFFITFNNCLCHVWKYCFKPVLTVRDKSNGGYGISGGIHTYAIQIMLFYSLTSQIMYLSQATQNINFYAIINNWKSYMIIKGRLNNTARKKKLQIMMNCRESKWLLKGRNEKTTEGNKSDDCRNIVCSFSILPCLM